MPPSLLKPLGLPIASSVPTPSQFHHRSRGPRTHTIIRAMPCAVNRRRRSGILAAVFSLALVPFSLHSLPYSLDVYKRQSPYRPRRTLPPGQPTRRCIKGSSTPPARLSVLPAQEQLRQTRPQALCSRAALASLCLCCMAQPNPTPTRAASSRLPPGSVVPSTSIPTSSPWRWRDPPGSFDRAGKQQKARILPRMWARCV